jgi:carboxypeptidase Q
MMGFSGAEPHFRRWLAALPPSLSDGIEIDAPGLPATGGSDHASFVCHGAPAFRLGSREWDYRTYTWHTNLDTFDKVVLDDVRHNALLTAMIAYQAAEDPVRLPRERRVLPPPAAGLPPMEWPRCPPPARSWGRSHGVR